MRHVLLAAPDAVGAQDKREQAKLGRARRGTLVAPCPMTPGRHRADVWLPVAIGRLERTDGRTGP